MGTMRSLAITLVASAVSTAFAVAQGPAFFVAKNLRHAGPQTCDLGTALEALVAGPPAGSNAITYWPAGTTLADWSDDGDRVSVTLGGTAHTILARGGVEDALEQLHETVYAHTRTADLQVSLEDAAGRAHPFDELWFAHHGARIAQRPARSQASMARSGGPSVPGVLAGRTIAISPGHGYYWHTSFGWTTQRGSIGGLIEDIHNGEIAIRYLVPALENLGAEVLMCREREESSAADPIVDNDTGAPAYAETGGWSTSASAGFQGGTYRFVGVTAGAATATASWNASVPRGYLPVYAFYRAGTNRAPDACYRIHHAEGTTDVRIDQTRNDRTWVHLGSYWFDAGSAAVELLNTSATAARVVIADAVRIGAGVGTIFRGAGTSGRPRWQEAARYWAQFSGAPSSVYNSVGGGQDNDDDVTCRPRFAEWRGADAFVSLHTNAGGASGTDTFRYSGGATAGSVALQNAVHTRLIQDIRGRYDPSWVDRGQKTANFGELRLLSTMPGVLIEAAFHDTPGSRDHDALHDPAFRRIVGEAIARGVADYFAPGAAAPPPPPVGLRVIQDGARGLRVAWEPAPGATSYTIEQSMAGKAFAQVAQVTGATSWSTGPLPHHSMRSFRVRAWNASGRSFPTEVLTAGTNHQGTAEALLVQGFDRLERTVKFPDNTFDYLALHGDALRRGTRRSLGFDAASNEAVRLGRVPLAGYRMVDWACGEESTQDSTFDATEQFLLTTYMNGGGRLLVSGAEIGWDLVARGSAADAAFYQNVLGAIYLADDAGVYGFAPVAGGLADGIGSGLFDDGTGTTYDVDWPDVITPAPGGSLFLRYSNGQGAGIARASGPGRVVNLGFPLETIRSESQRAALMQRIVAYLLDEQLTVPIEAQLGTTFALAIDFPAEAGQPYMLAASIATQPGLPLPGTNATLPLQDSPLISAGWAPNPYFQGFLGTLDSTGRGTATATVPNLPGLVGLEVFFSGATIAAPFAIRQVLPWRSTTLR